MFSLHFRRYAPYWFTLGALLFAMSVKFQLANASMKTLDFLLWFPAKVVSMCYSSPYHWGADLGYVFPDLGMYINKGCAAINFLVILFLALSTLVIFYTSGKLRIKCLGAVLVLSYPLTLLVNTFRILASVQMNASTAMFSMALRETLHELTGGLCFLGALVLFIVLAEKLIRKTTSQKITPVQPFSYFL